jgi:NAD(P)-dependent dehydrogenase (short-subunit alcohol dehydrogenase family)
MRSRVSPSRQRWKSPPRVCASTQWHRDRPTDTGMLDRFTGTPENKATLAAGVPLARLGKPADIAAAVLFLASEGASFVTG